MTLATSILIDKPVVPEEVFQFIRTDLFGATDERIVCKPMNREVPWGHSDYAPFDTLLSWGVGLPAVIEVEWHPDSYMQPTQDHHPPGKHFIEVTLDTGYAYSGALGGTCSDLHAWVVEQLGLWLLDRFSVQPSEWWWNDETGVVQGYSAENADGWYRGDDVNALRWLGDPNAGRIVQADIDRRHYKRVNA